MTPLSPEAALLRAKRPEDPSWAAFLRLEQPESVPMESGVWPDPRGPDADHGAGRDSLEPHRRDRSARSSRQAQDTEPPAGPAVVEA